MSFKDFLFESTSDRPLLEAMSEEDKVVVHLLSSLPESYDTLISALEANEKVPSMEVVIDRLIYEERKAKERDGSSSGEKGLVHQGQEMVKTDTGAVIIVRS